MKKFWALGLAAAMIFSLTACGNTGGNAGNLPVETPAAPETPAEGGDAGVPAESMPAEAESGNRNGSYEECVLTFSWWGGDSRHEATMAAIDAF